MSTSPDCRWAFVCESVALFSGTSKGWLLSVLAQFDLRLRKFANNDRLWSALAMLMLLSMIQSECPLTSNDRGVRFCLDLVAICTYFMLESEM